MRRVILVCAITPTLALAFLALTQTLLLAQSPKLDVPQPTATVSPIEATGTRSDPIPQATPFESDGSKPRAVDASAPALDSNPLRQRFIELSRKKARALDEEQLKREVDAMEAEVRELEAWARTQQAVQMLREITEQHRNTKAAEAASAAIQLLENRHAAARAGGTAHAPAWTPGPTFERQELAPVPDPQPEKDFPRPPQRDEKPKQPVSRLDDVPRGLPLC
jgi:hypothetical protein